MSATEPLNRVSLTDDDIAAVRDCLESGWLTMGPRTQQLEQEIAERTGATHAIATANGFAALHLAGRAAGIGPGDEVILAAAAPLAAANAVRALGATVRLCDSAGETRPGLDPDAARAAIGPATKAVIASHVWGYADRLERLAELCRERGLALIEDASEAIGARAASGAPAGTVGTIGCFGFAAASPLPVGEGGMVITGDDSIAATVRSLRSHAMTSVTWERHRGHGLGYDITDIGFNYRIDEPRSALALSLLARLDGELETRRSIARLYRRGLSGREGLDLVFDDEEVARSSHAALPVAFRDREARDAAASRLAEAGIESARRTPLHSLTLYREAGFGESLANAGRMGERVLLLPMHSGLTEARINAVIEALFAAPSRRIGDH